MKKAGGARTKLAAGFLAGATSRLLPASIPLRYFAAAAVFHLAAWLALAAGAATAPRFIGGLGWPLAALHLITLGVLAMTAIGASLQLMPVATRQPVHSTRLPAAIWWVYTAGVAATTIGMGLGETLLLGAGAIATVAGLLGYAGLSARNFAGARGMAGIVAHAWIALASLVVVVVSALSLALAYLGWPLLGRSVALALHVPFAAYGFMGMLALGLAYILVPMFALSPAPDETKVRVSAGLAALALALGAAAAAFDAWALPLRISALAAGGAAVALHLKLVLQALRTGMRRELGRSFRLVRLAWALLVASLVLALATIVVPDVPLLSTLFGIALVPGWLLTLVLGMMQRIVPFLASMHKAPGTKLPRTPSSLTAERPLAVHYACHLAALALLAIGAIADAKSIVLAASFVGAAGAVAFLAFFVVLVRRMRAAPAPHSVSRPAAPVA
ncbi:MAG: hypothetical protein M9885_02075 [Burkholderiaceae bacterium]|nr:hypothetical protein [Burkholderiaceae bacterium]